MNTISLRDDLRVKVREEAARAGCGINDVIEDALDYYFGRELITDPGYDAWFRRKIQEGLDAVKKGDVDDNEAAERQAAKRRDAILDMMRK